MACSAPEDSGASNAEGICGTCSAGGQTTDFGGGLRAQPTPCEESEQATPISEQEARAAGFGSAIALLARSFTSSFVWTAREAETGEPATGYQPNTDASAETRLAAFERLTPSLVGCEERLRVTLELELQTHDGALAIAGSLRSTVTAGEAEPWAFGRLDLTTGEGSLRVHPSTLEPPLLGNFNALLYFSPSEVRGDVWIEIVELHGYDPSSDVIAWRSYRPIDGSWPNDDVE